MNAPIAKDQLTFSLGNLTYIDGTYEEAPRPVAKPERHSLLDRVLAKVTEWRRRRQVIEEMAMMTDRELADIGLSRSDLSRVFDPSFAANHARGRDYIAY